MRALALAFLLAPLVLAGSAPAQPAGEPLNSELKRARSEQAAAEAQAAKLEKAVAHARGEAARLHAEQAAAAQAIDAAEARITAADTQLRLASAYVAARRQRLALEQQPVAALLAGLAMMAQRPPILAIADQGGVDELVKVRVLLDSTLPVIRSRTAALSAQLREGERLDAAVRAARSELVASRRQLLARHDRFAELERRALRSAGATAGQAVGAGDVALVAGETIERLAGSEGDRRASAALAAALAEAGPAPPRPFAAVDSAPAAPFAYVLPAAAAVIDGLDAVSSSGVKSRGITLATRRGAPVAIPAAGIVRFSGPFRDYDGILIIDHGRGWMSLILKVASPLKRGQRVRLGQPAGRALGAIGVELSQNGHRYSPALIAGSSQSLSKAAKGG
jgi:septal ring factor EnvC (AmiA/AmiB activator)